ncbi:MAG: hypothetical protein A2W98_04980 [Bacteroidetes bacterium GWF2_33_38]|nr:MAG: hypothetical protein A2W98_04980 [Bacteroidetes bacterium GWF2_33_38]OFY75638.1 MAG: hypothetical protein A2265_00050 [Bacteroidetes bacterium RIFOXYA12_FULL_33_9]OFY90648.1 MAG: hypothetical protein A2236_02640 [Bacteroidetes bacterium RIFOXYA2_FULL_33_7]
MEKIIVIIPYYGSWPNYIQIFNDTCKNNPLINICFITDLDKFENASSNITFFKLSFQELKKRIGNIFDISIPNHKPYKLCDFRPAYGIIFSDIVKDFDFWGYADNDLIFGNLKKFISSENLNENDILCFRPDHLHGPFTIYRNTSLINNLFKCSPDYLDIFKNEIYLSFDEFGKDNFRLQKNKTLDNLPDDSISVIALKAKLKGEIKIFMKLLCKEKISETNEIIKYDNGKVSIYKTNVEYAFYHWVIEKRAAYFSYPKWSKIPTKYFISPSGFYTEQQFKYYAVINFYRKTMGILYWYYLRFKNFPSRRLGFKILIDTYPRPGFIKK